MDPISLWCDLCLQVCSPCSVPLLDVIHENDTPLASISRQTKDDWQRHILVTLQCIKLIKLSEAATRFLGAMLPRKYSWADAPWWLHDSECQRLDMNIDIDSNIVQLMARELHWRDKLINGSQVIYGHGTSLPLIAGVYIQKCTKEIVLLHTFPFGP